MRNTNSQRFGDIKGKGKKVYILRRRAAPLLDADMMDSMY